MPSELLKAGLLTNRPELMAVGMAEGLSKGRKMVNELLQITSTLTWADKMLEHSTKQYSMISSLVEN